MTIPLTTNNGNEANNNNNTYLLYAYIPDVDSWCFSDTAALTFTPEGKLFFHFPKYESVQETWST